MYCAYIVNGSAVYYSIIRVYLSLIMNTMFIMIVNHAHPKYATTSLRTSGVVPLTVEAFPSSLSAS